MKRSLGRRLLVLLPWLATVMTPVAQPLCYFAAPDECVDDYRAPRFARYMAASARASTCSKDSCGSAVAPPTAKLTSMAVPLESSRRTGERPATRASNSGSAPSSAPGSTATSSSPPRRPSRSDVRSAF